MLENKKILPPLWLAYPEIARYSIGWRMGYGEDYIYQWNEWFRTLSLEEQSTYEKQFPEPPMWKGFWRDTDDCIYYHKNFEIPFWQKEGVPKYSLEQIQKDYRSGKKLEYCMFWRVQPTLSGTVNKGCLSQWYPSSFFSIVTTYCCMEQYMMAYKAELFGDNEIKNQILSCRDPKKIKALGQKVRNFDEVVWGKIKYSIVLNGNYMKFSQNPKLKDFLLKTGDKILVEASPYDNIWGIKMEESNQFAQNPLKWRGQNLLGFALMEVRDTIREVYKNEHLTQPITSN
ncbi:MAG: NADAR family protein [Lachnospiraceae bacterium]|jgi:conserved hypothetical protein, ribA/ribD-fused